MTTTSIQPVEEIKKGLFHTPFWLAPEQDIFAKRAVRFQELAQEDNSDWCAYLTLLAAVCKAQQTVSERHDFPPPELYQGETVLLAAEQSQVPSEFFAVFTDLLNEVNGNITATAAQETAKLKALPQEATEALAQRVLSHSTTAADKAAVIWVQAALQIIWTAWAAQLTEDHVPPIEERTHCPCCSTEAVGSVILIKGDLAGFRYMHCPLCNSRWNVLRAKCPTCGDAGHMRLQQVEADSAPDLASAYRGAYAESCTSCESYRKLYRQDKQQYADPVADDLATLGLDIAVGEAGFDRGGANPFLLLGE
ncbi:FdhE protein [Neisseria perflava]|uniref:formate dehydrogenase accessory protein FdhE n=1 Tax=Neisseria perflava TaxID=33053 RepID=UPI00209D1265|nr:formate dehydrogenase accessory protein FdhE [Neisseria perflava]MCP1771665.1 FdhE protein [Neisseria perflava]